VDALVVTGGHYFADFKSSGSNYDKIADVSLQDMARITTIKLVRELKTP
jgi:hypothetical protein